MRAVRAILIGISASLISGCGESPAAPVKKDIEKPPFCDSADAQCSEKFGFAVSATGSARYLPNAKGMPFKTIFDRAQRLSVKDEFETTDARNERAETVAPQMTERYGPVLAFRAQDPSLTYDADVQELSIGDDRDEVHELLHRTRNGMMDTYTVASQPCEGALKFEAGVEEARGIVETNEAGKLSVFFVGTIDPGRPQLAFGFELVVPGFQQDRFWFDRIDQISKGLLAMTTYAITMDLQRVDLVDTPSGRILKTLTCT